MLFDSHEVSDSGPQPPSEFVRLVRDALIHLYDPAHLLRHPLHGYLSGVPGFGDTPQGLRNLLIDAIESLAPPDRRNPDEKEQRPYLVLVQRYVVGYSPEQIAENLHIGPRQFSRELRKGFYALASYLHERAGAVSQAVAPAEGADLHSEIEALGLRLEPFRLAELIASLRPAAEALAKEYGAGLVVRGQGDVACLGDRTLARQAALSGLSALCSRSPHSLEVKAVRAGGSPCLVLGLTPPLVEDTPGALEQDLATCGSLMAEQGGNASLVRDEGGACQGLRLTFRPSEGALVLVVDDNAKMLHLYSRYLAAGSYRVSTAASAAEAQSLLTERSPDAIVLDVMMREVDGWQLLQWVRSQPLLRHVPVIVCSVLNEPKLALSLGARGYLKKPVAAGDLLAALRRVLGESSQAEPSPAAP